MYYRSKEKFIIVKYELGMEDGFSCIPNYSRCQYKDENGNYKNCKKCNLILRKLPYITTSYEEEQGEYEIYIYNTTDYVIIFDNGRKDIISKKEFEKNYEPIGEQA